jgi:hypothetical protein
MKLTYLNKVSRAAVLEILILAAEDTIKKLEQAMDYWDLSSGDVAPQVVAHFRREIRRQHERMEKLKFELDELHKKIPSGWRCGHRSAQSGWDCVLHAGHREPHYYGEGKEG